MPETSLPLMEMFPTIQGEGQFQGRAAFFIRLAGCDVGCTWCDVKESWDANVHPNVRISTIVSEALRFSTRLVVITGGEPLMYDLTELTEELKKKGFDIHIETSGTYPLTGQFDWITLSPKKFKPMLEEFYRKADELKVVVFNNSDIPWAEEHAKKMKKEPVKLFLQPEWSKSDKMLPQIIQFVQENPKWEVSLQIHKFMDIP